MDSLKYSSGGSSCGLATISNMISPYTSVQVDININAETFPIITAYSLVTFVLRFVSVIRAIIFFFI